MSFDWGGMKPFASEARPEGLSVGPEKGSLGP